MGCASVMVVHRLTTAQDVLTFDAATGALLSLRPRVHPDRELLVAPTPGMAFVLQYLVDGEYHQFTSEDATATEITPAAGHLTLRYARLGGRELNVTLTVTAGPEDRFSHWTARIDNGAGLILTDLQFPVVVIPQTPDAQALLPHVQGQLVSGEHLAHLPEDTPRRWQFWPENGNSQHYPGRVFAQFLAGLSAGLGVYLCCHDTQGYVKKIQALRRPEGLRLGLSHVGDWPQAGSRDLEYEVLLGSFTGDWYEAAELYRSWALGQAWAVPLTHRTDIPEWLLESPPHITIRLQGYVDAGPAPPITEFLPYEKCLPLLEGIAEKVDSPLVAVLMSWERGGPWVYPDCFPPVGGEESMTHFCRQARARGWHVGSFCNGTRWVTRHLFNDYDGTAYFAAHKGQQGCCRQPDGTLWHENWDQNWRPSTITCLAQEQTVQLARDFVRRLIGWGMESIQFFDQNCNASTFPCFATDHGHPPLPGRWMHQAMAEMMAQFRAAAAEAGETAVIHSTEWPTNEVCLPLFQQSDLRISAPASGDRTFAPLYQYLYHECTLTHGMMALGPEPFALEARTAWECVWGEMVGAVMTGDGTLLNRETWNWAEWEPRVGHNDHALEMMRTATALRRGAGRNFLVYGRLQRPPTDLHVPAWRWEWEGLSREAPAVAHALWQAPDGRLGLALANWTTSPQIVRLREPRLGAAPVLSRYARAHDTRPLRLTEGELVIELPELSCAVVTAG